MKQFLNMLLWILGLVMALYLLVSFLVYFNQEKLIFFPEKLPANYQFTFATNFTERNIKIGQDLTLNGLLFHVNKPKGLIFYLHGNAGALDTWGMIAETYTNLNYDVFLLDYRGYGKSTGKIINESQFYSDVQMAYDDLRRDYPESSIVIIGYSIGSGPAAMLASRNHPRMLILQAPYYSLVDLTKHLYPFLPTFALKYKFKTFEFVQKTRAPIVIFHGQEDEVIYYGSSTKLKFLLKPGDKLIALKRQGHNGINENPDYIRELRRIL